MRRRRATLSKVGIRATILALRPDSSITLRFQASAHGTMWTEIDSFQVGSIGIHERWYPAPLEPRLRVLSEPLGAERAAVVRTHILRLPEPEGPQVERGN